MAFWRALLGILLVAPLSTFGLADAGEAVAPISAPVDNLIAPSFPSTERKAGVLSTLVTAPRGTGLANKSLLPAEEELGNAHRIVRTAPYSDVDGDRIRDVLELDLDLREGHPIYGFKGKLRLNTLSGKSGKVLARHSIPFDSGVPWVIPARLGRSGDLGILVLLNRFITSPEHPTSEFIATAVSARGKELWSRKIIGTSTSTPSRLIAATDLAFATDLLGAPGKAENLLLGIYDYAGTVLTLTPATIDGITGKVTEQLPIAVPWVEGTPTVVGAPDLDTDLDLGRRDDFIIVNTTGLGIGVMARSSSTGQELWHNDEIPSGEGLTTARMRDVTGNWVPDFVLGAPLRLFDGATGVTEWEKPGGSAVFPTGRADDDKRLDLMAVDLLAKGKNFGAEVQAVSATGKVLGRERFLTKRAKEGFSWLIYDVAGDVNGDRVGDAFIWLIGDGERNVAIDGASGRGILEGKGLYPLKSSINGRAEAELATVTKHREGFLVTARNATGRALWSTRVSAPKDQYVGSVYAVGDSVVVTVGDHDGAVTYTLDGRGGTVLWTRVIEHTSGR